ncbi:MAG: selenide, water dikinase SelD [Dehalococcoidia bacterium]|nr:selenide, water dikinase SelD [Dehalococcoidia bacterium]
MGLGTLAQVLRPIHERFKPEDHPDLLVGLARSDDAAVFRVSDDLAIIQTLDFFPPVVDDPYTYGVIAAVNAMSDVYAMGGEVRLALNIAAWPDDLDPGLLSEVFRGGADAVAEAGGVIAGGHTVFDKEPKYGLSVMGMVHPGAIITKGGAQAGDVLLLTKPLGTGILMTAAKQRLAGAETALEGAVASMRRLNRHAAHLARAASVHAMTDVTGFALVGHAAEMAEQAGATFVLETGAVPELPGARRFAGGGAITGGASRNREQLGDRIRLPADLEEMTGHLLYDPQTSGGLLIAVPVAEAEALRARIAEVEGACWIVGHVAAGPGIVVVR